MESSDEAVDQYGNSIASTTVKNVVTNEVYAEFRRLVTAMISAKTPTKKQYYKKKVQKLLVRYEALLDELKNDGGEE